MCIRYKLRTTELKLMTPVVSGYFFFCLLSYFWMQLKVIINLKKNKKTIRLSLQGNSLCINGRTFCQRIINIILPTPSPPPQTQTNKQKHLVGRFFSNVLQCFEIHCLIWLTNLFSWFQLLWATGLRVALSLLWAKGYMY